MKRSSTSTPRGLLVYNDRLTPMARLRSMNSQHIFFYFLRSGLRHPWRSPGGPLIVLGAVDMDVRSPQDEAAGFWRRQRRPRYSIPSCKEHHWLTLMPLGREPSRLKSKKCSTVRVCSPRLLYNHVDCRGLRPIFHSRIRHQSLSKGGKRYARSTAGSYKTRKSPGRLT